MNFNIRKVVRSKYVYEFCITFRVGDDEHGNGSKLMRIYKGSLTQAYAFCVDMAERLEKKEFTIRHDFR